MNVTKKFFVAICCLSMFSLLTYAQDDTQNLLKEATSGKVNVQPKIDKNIIDDINNISLRFCNDGIDKLTSRLSSTLRPGQVKQFCTMFFNNSQKEMVVHVGFTEATKNTYNEWLCDDNPSENNFAKLIREDFNAIKLPVQSGMQTYKIFTLGVPKSASGDIIGCLSYTIDGSYSKNTGDVFGVVIRKTAPMLITVTGDVYNYGRRDDIKYSYTSNRNTVLKFLMVFIILGLVKTVISASKKKAKK